MKRRSGLAYTLLIAVWVSIVAWQWIEHVRVTKAARAGLLLRARDITTTLGVVIRSQRFFGGLVSQERLESALSELVKSDELISVALINASGDVVASAGGPIDLDAAGMLQTGLRWEDSRVTLVNLVDLGAIESDPGETNRPTIVLPRRPPGSPPDGPPGRDESREPRERSDEGRRSRNSDEERGGAESEPPREDREFRRDGDRDGERGDRGRARRRPFGRPPWMNEEEYQNLLQKRGLHGLVVAMSTAPYWTARANDLWIRWIIGGFATVSVFGFGFAWRNMAQSSELQMRLMRASELNGHLRELNVAAAGLAHETRNPLNIIRGMAQLLSKQADTSTEVRRRSTEILVEVDRVTAQLNEFINYSRPREVRAAPVRLGGVLEEVARALSYDIEEKSIQLSIQDDQLTVEADEQLLRQALFNLLLNSVQAVQPNGRIEVSARAINGSQAILEVRDDGPGVPEEKRLEIFKPYFTTHAEGTGLGLAVVQQIVRAHGWDIECLTNSPHGALFRITHMTTTRNVLTHAS